MTAQFAHDRKQHLAEAARIRQRGGLVTTAGARRERDSALVRRVTEKAGGA